MLLSRPRNFPEGQSAMCGSAHPNSLHYEILFLGTVFGALIGFCYWRENKKKSGERLLVAKS